MSMTREELHEQVWSQPMRTLAASIGISDVALARRCKTAMALGGTRKAMSGHIAGARKIKASDLRYRERQP